MKRETERRKQKQKSFSSCVKCMSVAWFRFYTQWKIGRVSQYKPLLYLLGGMNPWNYIRVNSTSEIPGYCCVSKHYQLYADIHGYGFKTSRINGWGYKYSNAAATRWSSFSFQNASFPIDVSLRIALTSLQLNHSY